MLYIIIGILSLGLLLSIFFMLYYKEQNKKIRKNRGINMADLIESTGEHGMFYGDDIIHNYRERYIIEFKVIGKAKRDNDKRTHYNIKVLKVSYNPYKLYNGRKDDNIKENTDLYYGVNWINDSETTIFWFTDNDARKRDNAINQILEEKNEQ